MTELDEYRLDDRFEAERGRVVLSGVQALVRGPLDQVRADRRRELRTAALIAGYQGSPLGTVDSAYARNREVMEANDVRFQFGVNEELAATMIWGSQQAVRNGGATHDGVIGLWYGKGPGLDRAGDAIRHGNLAGVGPTDGVVIAAGDDPAAKSSTAPSASEASLADLAVPTLYPGSVQDVLDYTRWAYEISRLSGAWVAVKIHTDVADATATIDVDHDRLTVDRTRFEIDGVPFYATCNDAIILPHSLELEHEAHTRRTAAAVHTASLNRLARTTGAPSAWLGIVAAGKAYFDVRGALARLGFERDDQLADIGVRIHKPAMIWPLDTDAVDEFVRGLETVLVVEEKRPFLELHLASILYGRTNAPALIGKTDVDGAPLISSAGGLEATTLIEPLRRVLETRVDPERLVRERERIPVSIGEPPASRSPYFCSGCPHNRSTAVPEGSIAGGGIGCHSMALFLDDERVTGLTQMGGEGAQWAGMAPFVTEPHRFQNIGDGTFAHSGSLAIRQAVSAGTDVTFKILYNGTVAMTGGQDAAGNMAVPDLTRMLEAEGVTAIAVVSDDPGKYEPDAGFAPGTQIAHRDNLDDVQRRLRDISGTTVLIYDQGCAAELRRARKRGTVETPRTRVMINEAVCDGCGHCGEISNCMSVHPVETPLGRKTRIHQESCNLDLSCLGGECPAFITVEIGDGPTRPSVRQLDLPDPPEPKRPTAAAILTVGIGGTGVVTVNQLLATAALLDGLEADSLDQIGLAQKGGPVVSHLRIGPTLPEGANRITDGAADTFLVFDVVAGVAPANLSRAGADHTVAVVSTSRVPTGHMVANTSNEAFPALDRFRSQIDAHSRPADNVWLDAEGIARELFQSQPAANMILLGVAYQRGLLPISAAAIIRAIELNGVAVDTNLAAFRTGRAWVVDSRPFAEIGNVESPQPPRPTRSVRRLLDTVSASDAVRRSLEWRLPQLLAFGGSAWAERYLVAVRAAAAAEHRAEGDDELTLTVAHQLAKFMLYKDEYEVARLQRDPALLADIKARFGDDATVHYQLKPPTLAALGYDKKIGLGRRTGAVAFGALRGMKRLRGTSLDPFGRTEERRLERDLIDEYEALVHELTTDLSADRLADAIEIAALADQVRGYSHVKLANIAAYRSDLQVALTGWRRPDSTG